MTGIRGGARGRRKALVNGVQVQAAERDASKRTNTTHKLDLDPFMRELLAIPYTYRDLFHGVGHFRRHKRRLPDAQRMRAKWKLT